MKKASKTLLAAIAAGLGASVAKLIYNHSHTLENTAKNTKQKANHIKNRIDICSYPFRHDYAKLSNDKKSLVGTTLALIVPDNPSDDLFKLHARQYKRVLMYISERHDYNTKEASTFLNVSQPRMYALTKAMLTQGLLANDSEIQDPTHYDKNDRNFVRQHQVKHLLTLLVPYFNKTDIPAKALTKALRNIIAREISNK